MDINTKKKITDSFCGVRKKKRKLNLDNLGREGFREERQRLLRDRMREGEDRGGSKEFFILEYEKL